MADTEHQIDLQHDSSDTAPTPAGGKPRPEDALKDESGNIPQEVRKAQQGEDLTDEEYQKIECHLEKIIDSGLQTVKPLLKLIRENMEELEKMNKDDDNSEQKEKAFVEKMKPLLQEAASILNKTLDQVEALDPNKKIQQRAQRASEDQKATPEQEKIAKGLAELTKEVTETINHAKEKMKHLPRVQKELSPFLDLLSKPLFQILSAVGLLVVGVLNLVGNILDALGLGGIVSGLMGGLGLDKLFNYLGWKVSLVKNDKDKSK